MTTRGTIITAALLVLGLAGCTSATATQEPMQTPSAVTSATPTPVTSVATEAEVAAIVKDVAPTLEGVILNNEVCRATRTYGPASAAEEASLAACFISEATVALKAGGGASKLTRLTPPPIMRSMSRELSDTLQQIADADIETHCGLTGELTDNPTCGSALATLDGLYAKADRQLDRWEPWV